MATSTNIKQWKIDLLNQINSYISAINRRKERQIDPKREYTGAGGSGERRPELRQLQLSERASQQVLLTFQYKLVEALSKDGIENSISQPILASYVAKVLPILMTDNTTLLRTIKDWVKTYIDPLIIPGT